MEISSAILLKLFFLSMKDHQLTQEPKDFVICSSHHGSEVDKHMAGCKLK